MQSQMLLQRKWNMFNFNPFTVAIWCRGRNAVFKILPRWSSRVGQIKMHDLVGLWVLLALFLTSFTKWEADNDQQIIQLWRSGTRTKQTDTLYLSLPCFNKSVYTVTLSAFWLHPKWKIWCSFNAGLMGKIKCRVKPVHDHTASQLKYSSLGTINNAKLNMYREQLPTCCTISKHCCIVAIDDILDQKFGSGVINILLKWKNKYKYRMWIHKHLAGMKK